MPTDDSPACSLQHGPSNNNKILQYCKKGKLYNKSAHFLFPFSLLHYFLQKFSFLFSFLFSSSLFFSITSSFPPFLFLHTGERAGEGERVCVRVCSMVAGIGAWSRRGKEGNAMGKMPCKIPNHPNLPFLLSSLYTREERERDNMAMRLYYMSCFLP